MRNHCSWSWSPLFWFTLCYFWVNYKFEVIEMCMHSRVSQRGVTAGFAFGFGKRHIKVYCKYIFFFVLSLPAMGLFHDNSELWVDYWRVKKPASVCWWKERDLFPGKKIWFKTLPFGFESAVHYRSEYSILNITEFAFRKGYLEVR